MLQLSGSMIGKNVLSLRSGAVIARIESAVINPKNLKIEGFYVDDLLDKRRENPILLYQDIRDIISKGFIVNDHENLTPADELPRLKKLLAIEFELIGMPVYTLSGEKVGKVNDYAAEIETMYIQKLHVSRSLLKSLSTHSLSVDRSQIHEITGSKIVIQELLQGTPAGAAATA